MFPCSSVAAVMNPRETPPFWIGTPLITLFFTRVLRDRHVCPPFLCFHASSPYEGLTWYLTLFLHTRITRKYFTFEEVLPLSLLLPYIPLTTPAAGTHADWLCLASSGQWSRWSMGHGKLSTVVVWRISKRNSVSGSVGVLSRWDGIPTRTALRRRFWVRHKKSDRSCMWSYQKAFPTPTQHKPSEFMKWVTNKVGIVPITKLVDHYQHFFKKEVKNSKTCLNMLN